MWKKEKMLVNQHFLLFPQCFLEVFLNRFVKSCDCVVKLMTLIKKTLEKGKNDVTSILSFSHNVFYPTKNDFFFVSSTSNIYFYTPPFFFLKKRGYISTGLAMSVLLSVFSSDPMSSCT